MAILEKNLAPRQQIIRMKYACFVSHRSGGDAMCKIVEKFRQGLEDQLDLLTRLRTVYVDADRLKGGDYFNKSLAKALCQSCCMILLFDPDYFDLNHDYCAREYHAMLDLEKQRYPHLGRNAQDKSLIIPVVIRGENSLPGEIKSNRQYFNFEKTLLEPADFKKRACIKELQKIADVVYHRMRLLKSCDCWECADFDFPDSSNQKFKNWLKNLTDEIPSPPMPGSSG